MREEGHRFPDKNPFEKRLWEPRVSDSNLAPATKRNLNDSITQLAAQ
jgi:hypothetical protein